MSVPTAIKSDGNPAQGRAAILVAAGRGTRAGPGGPKQYRLLSGKPILARTAASFLDHPQIDHVRVIIHRDDREAYDMAMTDLVDHPKLLSPVFGGAQRQDSVRLGLESLTTQIPAPAHVLIHDAARPFVDAGTITRVCEALKTHAGAIAALPVFDTLKRASGGAPATIAETVPRENLWRAQTPQGFVFAAILSAHRIATDRSTPLTDDAAVAEAAGIDVALVPGSPDNMKITQAEDFGMAETLIARHA